MSVTRKFNVVAVGRACTDIVAHVDKEYLKLYHIPCNGQRQVTTSEMQEMREHLLAPETVGGGPSANTVADVTALGGKAGFFGKINAHEIANNFFLNDLNERGIVLCCNPAVNAEASSAFCLVLLTDHHRSFAFNPGCADDYAIKDFAQFDFTSTDFFLIEAHLLTSANAMPAVLKALEFAQSKCQIVVNLHGILSWKGLFTVATVIAEHADIIIGNQSEQMAFAQIRRMYQRTADTAQLFVSTKGENGAEAIKTGDRSWHVNAISPAQLVSTVGAGDAFIAGFLMGLSTGLDIAESLNRGVHCAAAILEELGARPPVARSLNHLFQA
jgi:sugar/nucleoside kinase (ribokinase family)